MLIETVLCSIAVGSVEYVHRLDLIWPALGIAVSLHFLPLGQLFRVKRYYFTGLAGTVVCPLALVAFKARQTPSSPPPPCASTCGVRQRGYWQSRTRSRHGQLRKEGLLRRREHRSEPLRESRLKTTASPGLQNRGVPIGSHPTAVS